MESLEENRDSKEFFSSKRIEASIAGLRSRDKLRLEVVGDSQGFSAEIRTQKDGLSLVLTSNDNNDWSQFEGLVRSRRGPRLVANALSSGNFSTLFSDAEFELAYVGEPLDVDSLPEEWRRFAKPTDKQGTHLRKGDVFVQEWVIPIEKAENVECRIRFRNNTEVGALWKSVENTAEGVIERYSEEETPVSARIRRKGGVVWATEEVWERISGDHLDARDFAVSFEVLRLKETAES